MALAETAGDLLVDGVGDPVPVLEEVAEGVWLAGGVGALEGVAADEAVGVAEVPAVEVNETVWLIDGVADVDGEEEVVAEGVSEGVLLLVCVRELVDEEVGDGDCVSDGGHS